MIAAHAAVWLEAAVLALPAGLVAASSVRALRGRGAPFRPRPEEDHR